MHSAALSGIEVNTSGIKVVLAGFDLFPSLVQKLLVSHGVLRAGETIESLSSDRWFPLEAWLKVHEAIYKQIGPTALFKLGTGILENPKFPAWIRDIDTALEAIDIAFHRSHRKNGLVMCDPTTGQMMEGIGHYRSSRVAGKNKIEVTVDSPYLCEADLGIVTGLAMKFEAKARTVHGPGACRHKGNSSCTYVVTW